jgi:hypothetical protein
LLSVCSITVQSDWGGGEYERLNSFFRQVGISHHVSCPHTQQQNGVVESKHRHIVDVGLSLLATTSMPLKYWDEAFLAATYLINHTPMKLLNYDTPINTLLGTTPDYSNFRVFGCACWPNLRPYNSHKLQFQSIHCVFLGYSKMHKGLFETSTGRIYISRDVNFDETVFLFAKNQSVVVAQYTTHVLLLPEYLDRNNISTNTDESPICFPLPVFDSCVQTQVGAAPPSSAMVPLSTSIVPHLVGASPPLGPATHSRLPPFAPRPSPVSDPALAETSTTHRVVSVLPRAVLVPSTA